jgi:neutral amino acid transport system permease protein
MKRNALGTCQTSHSGRLVPYTPPVVPTRPPKIVVSVLGVLATLLFSASLASPAGAQEETEATESVFGTLQAEGEDDEVRLVEGAEITVATPDGEVIDVVETDEDGTWSVAVPGPGDYLVSLDADTLPEGVELRNEDRATLEVSVRLGQNRPILFALGEDPRDVGTRFDQFLQLLVEGVKFGLIIAMAAIGLSLIFGTTGLVNFAHGELVTFGALIAFLFNQTIGIHLIWAAILAMAVTGIVGGLVDVSVWRPLRRRKTGLIAMMVVSIGISIGIRYVFLYQFGGRTRPYGNYNLQRAIDIGPIAIAPKDLWVIALSLAVLAAVGLSLQLTRIGKAMRAVADNPDLAESSGIDVDRVILTVWVAGGALAALGGVFFGLGEQVSWQFGFQLLLLMFAGVTLGGLGTAYGALLGSFVIGMFVQVSTLWVSTELKNVGAFAVLIAILLVRPQGILGRAERVG